MFIIFRFVTCAFKFTDVKTGPWEMGAILGDTPALEPIGANVNARDGTTGEVTPVLSWILLWEGDMESSLGEEESFGDAPWELASVLIG